MIRLVFLLCAGLYLTALLFGSDHGQKRYGLMLADSQPKPDDPTETVARNTVFIPAQPVMRPVADLINSGPINSAPINSGPINAAPNNAATPDLPVAPTAVLNASLDTAPDTTAADTTVADTTAADTTPRYLTAADVTTSGTFPDATAALPAPDIPNGILYTVNANQANVRDGPGRSFAVTDTVTHGEEVLVLYEAQPIEGWSLIRIEGDGVEGYVSTKLLSRSR